MRARAGADGGDQVVEPGGAEGDQRHLGVGAQPPDEPHPARVAGAPVDAVAEAALRAEHDHGVAAGRGQAEDGRGGREQPAVGALPVQQGVHDRLDALLAAPRQVQLGAVVRGGRGAGLLVDRVPGAGRLPDQRRDVLRVVPPDDLDDGLPEHPPGEPVGAQQLVERLPLVSPALPEPPRPLQVGAAPVRVEDRVEAVPEPGVAHLPDVAAVRVVAVAAVPGQDLGGEPVREIGQPVRQAQHRLAHDRAVRVDLTGRPGSSSRHRRHLQHNAGASSCHRGHGAGHRGTPGLCPRTTGARPDCAASPKRGPALDRRRVPVVLYGPLPFLRSRPIGADGRGRGRFPPRRDPHGTRTGTRTAARTAARPAARA
ncbi:hypothetical protein LUX57_37955 [Actinomadura madurae]|uniref:hypothetical protein n=1 Tax=Actinomadura madurae TaxID=1993 RepID=UPI0020D21B07|nr:hypothetical protein [Actinomadura madurae]MCP9970259.1 hypothetical protein [Actinomadura madurae]